jgi:hypothetical protein
MLLNFLPLNILISLSELLITQPNTALIFS